MTPKRAALLLGLLCLLVYNANLRCIGAGDTLPARYLPLGIWRHGTLALDPIARLVANGHPSFETWSKDTDSATPGTLRQTWAYWIIHGRDGRLASFYPVVAPVLVAPLYLPAVVSLDLQGWRQWQVEWFAAVMEKLSASLIAALTVLVVHRLLRRDAGRWALPLTLAFAFGTNTWMISSQALWQHGTGELLIAIACLLVTSTPSPARYAALGAACVLMAANRPPDALFAAAFALYAAWAARRTAAWMLAGAIVPLALVVAYNLTIPGHLAGGYGRSYATDFFDHPLGAGLAGLLASPMRGLLVFSPFLLFVPLGLLQRLRTPGTRVLAALLAVAAVAQLVLYAKADWRAGFSWGPRWLTDMLPVLLWMLAPAPLRMRTGGRTLLAATMGVSIAIQAIGAFWYTGTSDVVLYAGGEDWMRSAWKPANAPFVAALREPPAHGNLACSFRGYVDRVGPALVTEAADAPAPLIASGMELKGWARACGEAPAQLLLIADGLVVGQTRRFGPTRPDVAAATGSTAPSEWKLKANTLGLARGEHVLQVAVRAEERSGVRIVSETRVLVGSPLDPLAARAAALLRERQAAAGYWLTTHTVETRFENRGQEMNTYLTAMLIDLLAPLAGEHGLEDAVERARRHLSGQIEPDGLVRYHGLPDGPWIGTLGCAITPDADDTALAWRIARPPAGDPRRTSMRRVLESYRDERGLYRTWLAPPERYQCLDPGRDPNPADVTIQMHVLMMLAEVDGAAARSLCRALRGNVSRDDVWVYYARAPLVPMLRVPDLRRAGCGLELPEERLAGVDGQQRWLEAGRRLLAAEEAARDAAEGAAQRTAGTWRPEDAQAALGLLAELARDDFAELRRTPPLLYHNDLSATVSRYYWSEDFGYALWLRLYEAVRADAERSRAAGR